MCHFLNCSKAFSKFAHSGKSSFLKCYKKKMIILTLFFFSFILLISLLLLNFLSVCDCMWDFMGVFLLLLFFLIFSLFGFPLFFIWCNDCLIEDPFHFLFEFFHLFELVIIDFDSTTKTK